MVGLNEVKSRILDARISPATSNTNLDCRDYVEVSLRDCAFTSLNLSVNAMQV